MKLQSIALALTVAVTALTMAPATSASAASVTLSGTVFGGGNELAGASVQVIDDANAIVVETTTNGSGGYSLTFEEGKYDLRYSGPSGSSFGDAVLPDEIITVNTLRDIVLTTGVVVVDGLVTDENGDPIPFVDDPGMAGNINIRDDINGLSAQANVDNTTGAYSTNVTTGTYENIDLNGNLDNYTGYVSMNTSYPGLDITTDTTLPTITVPFGTIDIALRDTNGNPTPGNVNITSNLPDYTIAGYPNDWYVTVDGNSNGNATDHTLRTTGTGTATLTVNFPGIPTAITQQINLDTTTNLTVTTPDTLLVDGLVTDENGDPIPFVDDPGMAGNINIRDDINGLSAQANVDNTTGAYSTNVTTGTYENIDLNGNLDNYTGYVSMNTSYPGLDITTDTTLPTITVPFGTIDIALRDTNGNPTPGNVNITSNLPDYTIAGYPNDWYVTVDGNSNGNATDHTLRTTGTGTATLTVNFPGIPTAITQQINLDTTTNLTVTTPDTLLVDGLVTDENGDPIPFVDDPGMAGNINIRDDINGLSAQANVDNTTGAYSTNVTTGTYENIDLNGNLDNYTGYVSMNTSYPGLDITTDTTLPTITVPFGTIDIALRDTNGNPTPGNVNITSNLPDYTIAGYPNDWYVTVDGNSNGNATDHTLRTTGTGTATLTVNFPGIPTAITQQINLDTTTNLTVLVTGTVLPGDPDAENDGDNVNDLIEALGPNDGDANDDEIPDAEQVNVASLPSFNGTGNYVAVAVPAGSSLTNVTTIDPAPLNPPANVTLPDGLNKFLVDVPNPGDDITVSIYPHAPAGITGYAKYQNDAWVELPTNRVNVLPDRVDITLTDGGIGDADGIANGVIDDPGGPSSDPSQLETVSGTVSFSDDQSYPGTMIEAYRLSDNALADDTTIDSATGNYELQLLPGDYELRVSSLPPTAESDPFTEPTIVTVIDAAITLDIVVPIVPVQAANLVGVVRTSDGALADGVRIRLLATDDAPVAETFSEPDGSYVLVAQPGTYRLVATQGTEAIDITDLALEAGETINLDLDLTSGFQTVTGSFVDSTGVPYEYGSVSINCDDGLSTNIEMSNATFSTVVSDANCNFSAYLSRQIVTDGLNEYGDESAELQGTFPSTEGTYTWTIPTQTVTITAVDGNNNPVAVEGVNANAYDYDNNTPYPGPDGTNFFAYSTNAYIGNIDTDGPYTLTALATTNVNVGVTLDNGLNLNEQTNLTAGPANAEFSVADLTTVTGSFVDSTGVPYEYGSVSINCDDGLSTNIEMSNATFSTVVSDANCNFSAYLSRQIVTDGLNEYGDESAELQGTFPSTEGTYTWTIPTQTVTITAVDGNNNPVAVEGVNANAYDYDNNTPYPGPDGTNFFAYSTNAYIGNIDTDGPYTLTALATTNVNVGVTLDNGLNLNEQTNLTAGPANVEFSVADLTTVTGSFVDSTGVPYEYGSVSINCDDGLSTNIEMSNATFSTVVSDANCNFSAYLSRQIVTDGLNEYGDESAELQGTFPSTEGTYTWTIPTQTVTITAVDGNNNPVAVEGVNANAYDYDNNTPYPGPDGTNFFAYSTNAYIGNIDTDGPYTLTALATTNVNVGVTLDNGLNLNEQTNLTAGPANAELIIAGSSPIWILSESGVTSDGDGVDDFTESNAPNDGDGNNDGTSDAEQASVASFPSATGSYITFAAPDGIIVQNVETIEAIADPVNAPPDWIPPPENYALPEGVADFSLGNVPEGGSVDVEIFSSNVAAITGYAKFQDGAWTTLPEANVDLTTYTDRVVITLVDGGIGDDDGVANGTIIDPGGIVTVTSVPDVTPPTIVCPATPRFVLNGSGAELTAGVDDLPNPANDLEEVSGVSAFSITVGIDTSELGARTVDVTATDQGGNAVTVGCNFNVGAELIPISHDFTGSTDYEARAGRSIPIRWQLVDADQATVGLDTISVTSVTSRRTSCPGSDTTDSDETWLEGDNTIRQLGNGDYQLVWKTKKSWRGTCRTFEIAFTGDLEPYVVTFNFR